ncbi:MAG: DUF3168 domain-containing protein [Tannerella sp.]|jgi:hypothetical protein|nr:DUF3168 domain-containing protein [Tannerella sp.]
MINKFKITNEIRAILLDNSAIKAYVDDRIYPVIAPTSEKGDFIIYQRDGYKSDRNKMSVTGTAVMVYVFAISENYDHSADLASLIYKALNGKFTEPDMLIQLEDSTEDFSDGRYIQALLFSIE